MSKVEKATDYQTLYDDGMSVREIAKLAGVSETTVYSNIVAKTPRSKDFSTEEIAEIASRYARGDSVKSIAYDYGIADGTVYNYIGVDEPSRTKKVTQEEIREVLDAKNRRRRTNTQICNELGISKERVYYILKRYGKK